MAENFSAENLPYGVGFMPSDEDIIEYLKDNSWRDEERMGYIVEIPLYDHDPCELKALYGTKAADAYYFASRREKKYKGGTVARRTTNAGYWKATGTDTWVNNGGVRKILVFYEGKAPEGTKTDWCIQEFRLGEPGDHRPKSIITSNPALFEGFVICKLYQTKSKVRNLGDVKRKAEGEASQVCTDDGC